MGWSPSRSLAGTNRRKLLFARFSSWTVHFPEPIPQTLGRRKRGFIPGTRPWTADAGTAHVTFKDLDLKSTKSVAEMLYIAISISI
jgi:hypothetical protein